MNMFKKILRKFGFIQKAKYEVRLADGNLFGVPTIEYGETGIKFPNGPENSYRFVPYPAILWVDFNQKEGLKK